MMEKREDGWWFHDPNNSDTEYQWVGPYETKKEAQEGKRGLDDFWKNLSGVRKKTSKRREDNVQRVSAPTQSLFAFD